MDAQTLANAMGNAVPLERYEQLVKPFNKAMIEASINNVERAAMWCAQIGHESVGLRYVEEIDDGTAYEGREDLGNTQPGDGARFKGRGPIQVTGRNNYTEVSKWAYSQGLTPTETFFVDNPEALGTEEYLFLGAVWYWTVARPQLNQLSDARDLNGATLAINGGDNGIEDRRQRYERCLQLGEALLPNTIQDNSDEEELDMEKLEQLEQKIDLILDQLAGPGRAENGLPDFSGWPQLGGKTLVGAVEDIRNQVV